MLVSPTTKSTDEQHAVVSDFRIDIDLPIVMLTNSDFSKNEKLAYALGVNAILGKTDGAVRRTGIMQSALSIL